MSWTIGSDVRRVCKGAVKDIGIEDLQSTTRELRDDSPAQGVRKAYVRAGAGA